MGLFELVERGVDDLSHAGLGDSALVAVLGDQMPSDRLDVLVETATLKTFEVGVARHAGHPLDQPGWEARRSGLAGRAGVLARPRPAPPPWRMRRTVQSYHRVAGQGLQEIEQLTCPAERLEVECSPPASGRGVCRCQERTPRQVRR